MDVDELVHVVVDGLLTVSNTHAGTAKSFRVSPPEAVVYLNGIKNRELGIGNRELKICSGALYVFLL